MAVLSLTATVGAAKADGTPSRMKVEAPKSASTVSGTMTTDAATVAANVATLVADGAAPTQAHVNTLNTNYTTLAADITALATAVGGDVTVSINLTNVATLTKLKAALDAIFFRCQGSSDFTP